MKNRNKILEAVQQLLSDESMSSQEDICRSLAAQNFTVSQSKISRLLRQCGAVKVQKDGRLVYGLSKELSPPASDSALAHLVLSIEHNEVMVVLHTSPGAAQLVARLLDFHPKHSDILGTLAGDDAIFVSPRSIKNIEKLYLEIRQLLGFTD
ncbi:Arginine repressor [Piscirickettsia salmonis]|uniref:Arginine repressor n=1 Tax=Piscirickettsia salmonis TaxID=1238 RepID=A0A1L6T9R3_PISSA|nr:arginine repressor [Piscirickettsia salmonis]RNC77655.1 arginine repressor [Piscirickettsiaceae bacterium NZ-RLO2]AKP73187.1 arginine repressor [Piscirickettsia salmonis LF-89 = ATCC VR-1361]ALB21865.1 arginine repressor [Piscirickettsia salmonis]ALY02042.1 arginine repressor [Piscirickettsia salmonis]AMA41552.1 arginine repressor [Piscirickettsia salmonis]